MGDGMSKLLGVAIIVIVIIGIAREVKKDNKKIKEKVPVVEKYLKYDRAALLDSLFPDCTYTMSVNYDKLRYMWDYELKLTRQFTDRAVVMTHDIFDDGNEDNTELRNRLTFEVVGNCAEITKKQWKKIEKSGDISEITQLAEIWPFKVMFTVKYKKGKIEYTAVDRNLKRFAIDCMEQDFVTDNAIYINRAMELIDIITSKLNNMRYV